VPKVGESVNGDAVVVRKDGARQLIAVVDALGHGPGAALAAGVAVEELNVVPLDKGVQAVIERVHIKLHGTRGAAAMVCVWDGERLEGCSVGNVEMRSRGTRVPVMLTPGILGARVRSYRIFDSRLAPSDRLVIFSDGISSHLSIDDMARLAPSEACRQIMERYRRNHDDATVLVADVEA
jgi:negative regulator of sigma-B (phosphoserine phosphatase)